MTISIVLLFFSSIAFAATIPSSTFVQSGNGGPNFTFSINVPDESNDLYFHLSGPSGNSWIAIGFGKQMKNALILLAYKSSNGKNVTLSPRVASGHSEPSYDSSLRVTALLGTGLQDNLMVVNGRCSNCREWKEGSLDVTSTAQSMIWAVGPDNDLQSNSMTAGIQRHDAFGIFTMDLKAATGEGGIPASANSNDGATSLEVSSDGDKKTALHGALMLAVFIIIFPLGVFCLRIMEKVMLHWIVQSLAIVIGLAAAAFGIASSLQFNKTKGFGTAHQIIGLLVTGATLLQLGGGWTHHIIYKRTKHTTPLAIPHRILGTIIIFLGWINGGLGFSLIGKPLRSIPYAIVCVLVAAFLAVALFLKRRSKKRRAVYETPAAQNFREGWEAGSSTTESNIELAQSGAAPGYSQPPHLGVGRR
ncbi:MAG: hypothetical protein M1834_009412 [Cirrosporium novae-zelandiae]|nr:MAG: hypothetical protein M1834_009412 [Cirrosporium novae-zelandiae]